MTPDKLLSASEVAKIYGVHIHTIKRIPPEELPYFRMLSRGDRKYKLQDVEGYLMKRYVTQKKTAK